MSIAELLFAPRTVTQSKDPYVATFLQTAEMHSLLTAR